MIARLPWYVAGPLIGLLMVALRAAANRPFGALGGYCDVAGGGAGAKRFGFRAFLLLGLVLGGLAYMLVAGTGAAGLAYGSAGGLLPSEPLIQSAILLVAGLVMGFGARMAGGCTSGHGMSGLSLASPASIAATMTFFATAVLIANALAFGLGGTP